MDLPRLRQLRRDKLLFTLAVRAVRLHLEEADRLAGQPHLREAPDAGLQFIQQCADQWVGLSTGYLVRKYRCTMTQALELLGELQADLRRGIPASELRQVPLQEALDLPPALRATAPGE